MPQRNADKGASCKDAELALSSSEGHFRTLVEAAPLPVLVETDGLVVFVSDVCERVLGFETMNDMLGREFLDFVHPDSRAPVSATLAESALTPLREATFLTVSGESIAVEFVVSPIEYAGRASNYVWFRDCSPERAAENLIRRFRAITDQADEAIFVTDVATGRFVDVNTTACTRLGYTREALLDMGPFDLQVFDGLADANEPRDDWYRRVLSGIDAEPVRYLSRHRRRTSEVIPVEVSLSVREFDGRAYALAVTRDISERVSAETKLRAQEADLRASAESLRRLSGGLIRAQEEERLRVAEELHDELSQELAAVGFQIAALSTQLETLDVELAEQAELIRERVGSLGDHVHAIAFALHPAAVDHLGIVAALKTLCKSLVPTRGPQVTFTHRRVPAQLDPVVRISIYRVVQEALRNAFRHASAAHVKVTLAGIRGGVQLTVADDGVGFDLDATGDNSRLGLASMVERVRLIEGEISFVTAPGAGTQVKLRIPLNADVGA